MIPGAGSGKREAGDEGRVNVAGRFNPGPWRDHAALLLPSLRDTTVPTPWGQLLTWQLGTHPGQHTVRPRGRPGFFGGECGRRDAPRGRDKTLIAFPKALPASGTPCAANSTLDAAGP